jgi:DNA polymerase-3 subunit gamma/tau
MSYLVLARKYRPQNFDSVTGQEHVTRTLGNAILRNKVAHAYVFAGPRGVGKTSISRIFAKALNCAKGPTNEPCMQCTNCLEITQGNSMAVREIDGASHNSVDNVRELIESFRALPPPGSRYKIYIIDEVHMLSTSAFNALLKSLEEPPPNTVFILATTEVQKIPETVLSRCQQFDLRALGVEEIEKRLSQISKEEGLSIEPEAIRMIARLADGSMRDAQSLLDRVQSFCDGDVNASEASLALGTVERRVLFTISQAVFDRQPSRCLEALTVAFAKGIDPALFIKEFAAHWREILLAKFGGAPALEQIGVTAQDAQELFAQASKVSGADVQDLVHLSREGSDAALRSAYPKFALESLLVRMASREPIQELQALSEQIRNFISSSPAIVSSRPVGSADGSNVKPMLRAVSPLSAPNAQGSAAADIKVTPRAEVYQERVARPLQWASFVNFASERGHRIVAEHLRRVLVDDFSAGRLKGKGPEFSISHLNEKDQKLKLLNVLEEYSGQIGWVVELSPAEKGAAPAAGSLIEQEEVQRKQRQAEKKEVLANHPKIKSLQKAFPGSTIETIKIKD